MKRCSGPCGLDLSIDAFQRDASRSTGRKSRCKECSNVDREARRDREKKRTVIDALPAPPVPEGFDVREVATQTDAEGNTEKQWLKARPEPTVFHEIQPGLPEKHLLKGVSTLVRGSDGGVIQQWVKTKTDHAQQVMAVEEACKRIADTWPERAAPTPAPSLAHYAGSFNPRDLMCVIPMGDPHFGMYAWAEESGDDFDLSIAEQNQCIAVDQLVATAPPAEEAVIINLGDYFHMDNNFNQTSRSHHILDVDTRWPKVVRVGIRAMRRAIDRALERFKRVRVITVRGNHDDHSALMLQLCLAMYYEVEPRVIIDQSPAAYYYHRFGDNLIAATHGHTSKKTSLGEIMAADRSEDWGQTTHRYWYTGHVHHDSLIELRGCVVETFRTLAPKDKYAADAGYRAGRDMKIDVLHHKYGRIQRNTIGIDQILRMRPAPEQHATGYESVAVDGGDAA